MGDWVVLEFWRKFEKAGGASAALVIGPFDTKKEAKDYYNWLMDTPHGGSELQAASCVQMKGPDPRYLEGTNVED